MTTNDVHGKPVKEPPITAEDLLLRDNAPPKLELASDRGFMQVFGPGSYDSIIGRKSQCHQEA